METKSENHEERLNELETWQENVSKRWIFDNNFFKRSFGVWGYFMAATLIISSALTLLYFIMFMFLLILTGY